MMKRATRVGGVLMGIVFALMMVAAGESAGGVPDGITITGDDGNAARPVEGGMVPQGAAQRWVTEHAPLAPEFPMSPVASCGQSAQSAPVLLAQVYAVCRKGRKSCFVAEPYVQLGERCCCARRDGEVWFCGGTIQPL